MDHALKHDAIDPARLARAKARDFRVMFWASLPAFLVVALAKRLIPGREPFHSVHETPRRGIVADAVHMANTFIPFAFMH
ncbi:hypothetical protein M1105_16555 [Limibaculum sp. FT325]|uniref:hypothetical protein n=1 Tax=Thermohalobaculum sediminis TaxID=2939436 RepID=UPI0020BDF58E|nr:hypothetical protein [Limibaculum sediminis]MCL5778590.1 hypothetical protein [Limibaculum sediminis]